MQNYGKTGRSCYNRLKCDDTQLKGKPPNSTFCDFYTEEKNLHHLVKQCPNFEGIHTRMYEDLYSYDDGFSITFRENPGETFNWIIRKNIEGVYIGKCMVFE